MRKNLLLLITAVLLSMASLILAFTACKKDDSITILEEDNPVLVSSIHCYYCASADFDYDEQNRLSSIRYEDGTLIPITYPSANTIVAIVPDPIYGGEYVFTLNNDGRIVKIKRPDGFEEFYEYENGYLKKGGAGVAICTWENGNLKSILFEDYDDTFTYSYSATLSKVPNIAPWTTPMAIIGDGGENFYHFFPSAYFGKSSKNLVASEIRNDIIENSYRYETNADGYVTKIYNTMTWIETGQTVEYLWCEIEYK